MLTAHSLNDFPKPGCQTADEVLTYLRELLEREEFSASERNRRFLSYVVQETVEGRGDRIKAYNIALAAFDRAENFDPLTDPIVRIEAGRLRRSLEHYYLTAGQTDRIRINIPKGSYAASFLCRAEMESVLSAESISSGLTSSLLRYWSAVSWNVIRLAAVMTAFGMIVGSLATYGATRHASQAGLEGVASSRPSLVIVPFEDTGGDPSLAFVARGLTYDVGTALTQLGTVAVFGPGHSAQKEASGSEFTSDFTLMGSVQTDPRSMRVAVFVIDSRTGQFLQSWRFQQDIIATDIIDAQAEVAQQILASMQRECAYEPLTSPTLGECRPISIAAN